MLLCSGSGSRSTLLESERDLCDIKSRHPFLFRASRYTGGSARRKCTVYSDLKAQLRDKAHLHDKQSKCRYLRPRISHSGESRSQPVSVRHGHDRLMRFSNYTAIWSSTMNQEYFAGCQHRRSASSSTCKVCTKQMLPKMHHKLLHRPTIGVPSWDNAAPFPQFVQWKIIRHGSKACLN